MGTPYFQDMISKNLAEDGEADDTYETYFLATKGQDIVLNNFDTTFKEILKVSHFLIPQNWTDKETGEVTPNVDYEALRTKFEILHYPLL